MGTSNWQNLSFCCELIHRLAPKRTLDIGIGTLGRWAMLVREFTDVWRGKVRSADWTGRVDGIEAFPTQVTELHRLLYDRIVVGDAFEVIDGLGEYDLVILGDVLEHFPEDRARPMLEKCLKRSRHVLVVTPLGELEEWPQGAEYGNPWEIHRVAFSSADFLDSDRWEVREHRLFRDFRAREFGAFLLSSSAPR